MHPADLALPGECHPALEPYREAILATDPDRWKVRVALVPRPALSVGPTPTEEIGPPFAVLTLTRHRASQSFYPRLGAWVWSVWRDDYGRMVAVDPGECLWVEHPTAGAWAQSNPDPRDDLDREMLSLRIQRWAEAQIEPVARRLNEMGGS